MVGDYAKPPHKVSPFAVEKASPPASLDGNEHSQHASTSCLRQGLSRHGVSEASDTAGLSQQPSGSESLRKAALSLNAQLALIDKQVLQHVIPHAQQSPSRHHSQDLAQQVSTCTRVIPCCINAVFAHIQCHHILCRFCVLLLLLCDKVVTQYVVRLNSRLSCTTAGFTK